MKILEFTWGCTVVPLIVDRVPWKIARADGTRTLPARQGEEQDRSPNPPPPPPLSLLHMELLACTARVRGPCFEYMGSAHAFPRRLLFHQDCGLGCRQS
jgi:hypothetical protein